ncbi:MAG TPA: hypothetical protein VLN46_06565 [Gillisia sp.]|nr:hypothetical protein [Gillisia sp.]
MKNILIVIVIFLSALTSLQAQDKNSHREKIKAMKVAFITQELNMSSQTAQKFWPVYNKYEMDKRSLHKRENVDWDNIGTISDSKAEEMLKEYLAIEREEYIIKKQLFSDLGKILSTKEIVLLHKLEADFNKKMIQEYRNRTANRN